MQQILILGAGRSSTSLIQYLLGLSLEKKWKVTICEKDPQMAAEKFPEAEVVEFDIFNQEDAGRLISEASIVISMMPAILHIHAAQLCASHGTTLLTASYLSDDIKSLEKEFQSNDAACIMELGLDPGLDHMSAMKVLDRLKKEGSELTGFETFTGGLLADDTTTDNPWQYKFTWNPRNVVMAGTGNVKFIQEGRFKYIPYHKLFRRTEVIHIPGYGYFEGYANRDSLKYLNVYQLEGIRTLYRGTLRRPGFCKAWDIFIQLGATDDTYKVEKVEELTHRQFLNSFLSYNPDDSVELKLAHYMNIDRDAEEMYKFKWLGMFDEELVGLKEGTPAQILEHILKKKWTLNETDKDMIVMWHKFNFIKNGVATEIQSSMVTIGDDDVNTAMSKTVGLPLAIAAHKILDGEIKVTGVHTPTTKNIYLPILDRLEEMGFEFNERVINA